MLRALKPVGVLVVAAAALERQAQRTLVEGLCGLEVADDRRNARDELNLHRTSPPFSIEPEVSEQIGRGGSVTGTRKKCSGNRRRRDGPVFRNDAIGLCRAVHAQEHQG